MCRSITFLIDLLILIIVFDLLINKIRTILIIVLAILAAVMSFHQKVIISILNIQLSIIKTHFRVKRNIRLFINSIKIVFIRINQINFNIQSRRRLKSISYTKENR